MQIIFKHQSNRFVSYTVFLGYLLVSFCYICMTDFSLNYLLLLSVIAFQEQRPSLPPDPRPCNVFI